MKKYIVGSLLLLFVFKLSFSFGQKTADQLDAKEKRFYQEHILEGQPDKKPVYVRQGYVVCYNPTYRIPDWTAYHVKPAYLKSPKREGRFSRFLRDPDISDPVVTDDYTGSGYARGHMAPFFVMGGDRDGNHIWSNASVDEEDPYDDKTVFQANYMSNIAPQSQDALNGAGGPWYALETAIRKKLLIKHKMELHVYTGSIISNPDDYYVLQNKKGVTGIAVPDEFYQVLIYRDHDQYVTAAFLFPHVDNPEDLPHEALLDYLVTVDDIEKKTGLNFLNTLDEEKQKQTESKTNFDFWNSRINN